jgi:hypothetical protein
MTEYVRDGKNIRRDQVTFIISRRLVPLADSILSLPLAGA